MDKQAAGPAMDWGVGRYERTAQLLLPAAQVLIDAAELRPAERVLDLGCGTGNATLLAAATGAHVTAVDPSLRLLDVAREAAQLADRDIVFEVGEAAHLPATEQSFDCVLSNFAVIFAPDPDAAVAEISRVLRPNGRTMFTAWLPGGAVGALAATAQELIRAAVGAPPASPGFAWHEEAVLQQLFARHGMAAAIESRHELVFSDVSPEAYLEAERDNHPLAVSGFQVLQQLGQADQAHTRLLEVLNEHNEDPTSFRSTSRYVVVSARRSP